MIKLLINGNDYTNCVTNVDTLVEVFASSNQSNSKPATMSGITFIDEGYEMIKDLLLSGNCFDVKELEYEIYDCECKRVVKKGVISSETVEFCIGCDEITLDFLERNEDLEKLRCLQNTMIWQNTTEDENGDTFQDRLHPLVPYQVTPRPAFLHITMIGIFVIMYLLIVFVNLLVTVINSIISTLCQFIDILNSPITIPLPNPLPDVNINPFSILPNCPDFLTEGIGSGLLTFLDRMIARVTGCGYASPAPFIRDYIQNVADHCGLEFESEIFNQESGTDFDCDGVNPYYNAMYFFNAEKAGYLKDEYIGNGGSRQHWIHANRPNETGSTLLDKLVKLYGAKWEIIDCVLYVNTEKWFRENTDTCLVIDSDSNELIEKLCLKAIKRKGKVARYQYCRDTFEVVGNEALISDIGELDRYYNVISYLGDSNYAETGINDIDLYSEETNEYEECTFDFGPARFRNDNIDFDEYTLISSDFALVIETIGTLGLSQLLGVSLLGCFNENPHQLTIGKHIMLCPKILIWDGTSHLHCANVIRRSVGGSPEQWEYNYPMYLDESEDCGIYNNFLVDRNPYAYPSWCYNAEFSICLTCENIELLKSNKYIEYIHNGVSYNVWIDSGEIDYIGRTANLKGWV